MITQNGQNINPYLPGGWETAPPYGKRLIIKCQKQGWKGDKPRTGRGDRVEQVAMVNDE
jgi:hypothetical protein